MPKTTEKTFTIAGTSFCKDLHKVRHANDLSRVKVLEKTGHTEIILVQLPNAMTKTEAAEFIKDLPEFASNLNQCTIADYIADQNGNVAVKEPKAAKEPKAKKSKVEPIVEQTFELEPAAVVEPAPVIQLATTKDTVTEEEWATLQMVG
jgi:anion-transporting  ArsA/GET3 family ATPase